MSKDIGKMSKSFTIAIASGKGGTGKTTLAVSMALSLARRGESVALLDADVEAPNAHLFLKAAPEAAIEVTRPVPQVDEALCTGCGRCREVCAFHAIVMIGGKPLVFPELCHGCGACKMDCPTHAIGEVPSLVGWLESAETDGLAFMQGRLKVGEAKAPPLIRALKKQAPERGWTILDAPPGTSCPVISAVRDADFVLLVTEPTPFGLNDLKLAVGLVRALALPFGVVVNRAGYGDRAVYEWCEEQAIPILLEIPFSKKIASAYAHGGTLLDADPSWDEAMQVLLMRCAP